MEENNIPESAMVIVAHPDDAEFTVAGTVAAWTKAGCRVTYVVCTDGNTGSHEPGGERGKLLATIALSVCHVARDSPHRVRHALGRVRR